MMQKNKIKKNSGFTLIEILVVVCIVGIMASVVLYNLSSHRNIQLLTNSEDEVVALINEARSRTVSADLNSQYGVHLETNRAVLFSGTSFTDGASGNREIRFDSSVNLASISLSGGGSNIVFKKMTGETDQSGSFVVKNVLTNVQKTVSVVKTGIVFGN